MNILALTIVAASVVTFVLTPVFRAASRRYGVLDVPNERSSHTAPTPRSGGNAMAIALLLSGGVAGVIAGWSSFLAIGAALVFILLSGVLDDVRGLREWQKLLLQIAAAVTYVALSGNLVRGLVLGDWKLALAFLAVPFTVVWLVGFTNVFNFMDGVNGIASLQAIVSGIVLGLLAYRIGDRETAFVGFAVAAVAAGFLPWNFPRASIFMGDTGSATLGFLIAVMVVRLSPQGILVAILPLFPFLFDGSLTLLRRMARRETWFRAHRSHLYQRLTIAGWSHTRVTLLWTLLAVAGGVVALNWPAIAARTGEAVPFLSVLALHGALALFVSRVTRR